MSAFPSGYMLFTEDGAIPVRVLRESILTISVIGVNPSGYDEQENPVYHMTTLNKKTHKGSLFSYGLCVL